ncbi:hypothetical protein [Streptomyces europaeiscabiei]|uniref:hypothetical protein n=1 Tax=Streptomyces europaeiscabiei TaxID=146819 RepID=UPI0029BC514F|nr:hypothetical protein [Streptomyces europaeiscabiei]MDX3782687.1 hypothetical protein [Streptomyces europaeiscabiei]
MSTLRSLPLRNPFTGEGAAWRIAGAAMLVVTVAGQHPFEQFSRFRSKDVLSLVPNWRFFAPNPCMHDSHFLYRMVDADGNASPWHDAFTTETRKPQHIVWFPTRRADKGVVDACADILPTLEFGGFEAASRTAGYRMVTEHLRVLIRSRGPMAEEARGFQFALARATGYDTRHRPSLVFVSPFVPLDPQAAGTPLTRAPANTPAKV